MKYDSEKERFKRIYTVWITIYCILGTEVFSTAVLCNRVNPFKGNTRI